MAVAECDRIRRKTGGDLTLVHHQGWSKARPRGASALFGALDELMRAYRTRIATRPLKWRHSAKGLCMKTTRSCSRLVDGVMGRMAPEPKGVEKLRERERKMLDVLDTLCTQTAGAVPIEPVASGGRRRGPASPAPKSKKGQDQQWRRAIANLKTVESIQLHGANVIPWRPSDDFAEEE